MISTQWGRKGQQDVDSHLHRERNVREGFWSKAEPYRTVATRHEKLAANYMAFVKLAAIMVIP